MEVGTYEGWWWVNRRRFPQILDTHHLLISDRPRSQAETDADARPNLITCRARWVVGGHGLCYPCTASYDRDPSRPLISEATRALN